MPPAFNLSQDQTLKFNLCCWYLYQRRTHSELKKKMFFVFTSNLSTQFSKFSRSSKLLGHLRFTGYSRLSVRWSIFKEQFVARFELTSLRIIRLKFVLSSAFENIFYSLFSLDCRSLSDKDAYYADLLVPCQIFFQIFFLLSFPITRSSLLFRSLRFQNQIKKKWKSPSYSLRYLLHLPL